MNTMMDYMYQWMVGWGTLGFTAAVLTVIVLALLIVWLIKQIDRK